MKLRAVAVARALALLGSGGAVAACGSAGEETPNPAPPLADAGTKDQDASTGAAGACITFRQADVPCASGGTCYVDETSAQVRCGTSGAGLLHACGAITCGWDCSCGSEERSECACIWGVGGPLAPPDLPV